MIITDASPLIMLARSGLLPVLQAVAGAILVPDAVWDECVADPSRPGASALLTAQRTALIAARKTPPWSGDPLPALCAGERAAIALAASLKCIVLMDERLGRMVARREGLSVTGSAAILLKGKQRGLLTAIRPILENWRGAGYFLGNDLLHAVLERAGET